MVRTALWLAVATATATACTPAQAPAARRLGQVMSLAGVGGMIAGAATSGVADTHDVVVGFSVVTLVGICTYAVGELSDPPKGRPPETEAQKLRRWARILTERAGGAAREGRCARVRRLEKRVNLYDREVHDFVFMRDAEILKCLDTPVTDPTPPPEGTPVEGAPLGVPADSLPTLRPAPTPPTDPPPLVLPPRP